MAFIEPAIFRGDPLLLRPHLDWLVQLAEVNAGGDHAFALFASPELCADAKRTAAASTGWRLYPFEPYEATRPYGHDRVAYSRGLFGDGCRHDSLHDALSAALADFVPTVALMTSQNACARRAFRSILCLSTEIAPLPRTDMRAALFLDPCGHQSGSLLNERAGLITAFPIAPDVEVRYTGLLQRIKRRLTRAGQRGAAAVAALSDLRQRGKVALLALQPPDWVNCEGQAAAADPERLLLQWASELPAGWVGVATYHPIWRLPAALEPALRRANPRLQFLPGDLAHGTTEALLCEADGLVTVSSTVAATALLFGRRVAVTGTTPFNRWCVRSASRLDVMHPLTPRQASAMLAFLTHRYIHAEAELLGTPGYLPGIVEAMCREPGAMAWVMDPEGLDPSRAEALFALDDVCA